MSSKQGTAGTGGANNTLAASSEPHIRLVDVTKTFPVGGENLTALDGVSVDIPAGSITGIVGYSGAGKSTLVRLINALERPTSGQVIIDGQDITGLKERQLQKIRRSIGMVFQHFNLFNSRTVAGNIAFPLKTAGWKRADIKPRVEELLNFVGLSDKGKTFPRRLSGGQKQRIGIARALATSPKILLADEATSALDPETTADVLALLRRINREFGTTVIVITHEMSVVREICDRVIMMDTGRVVEAGSSYDVFSNPESTTTRKFVDGAVLSQPNADTVDRLTKRHPGTLAAIGVRDDIGTAHINDVLERHSVRGSVVFGGVTEVHNKALGSLTYALRGPDGAVNTALSELGQVLPVAVLSPSNSGDEQADQAAYVLAKECTV